MYKIICGEYQGRIGNVDFDIPGKKYGNCMFYPIEGEFPYRICVKIEWIEKI